MSAKQLPAKNVPNRNERRKLIRDVSYKAGLIKEALPDVSAANIDLPVRPPMLCPGCGHRGLFYSLKRLDVTVFGDIGCYTLGAAAPLSAIHASTCMGASFAMVHGVDKMGVKGRTVGSWETRPDDAGLVAGCGRNTQN